MSTDPLIEQTRRYYDDALRTHGATPRGVDWNSVESQELRFDKLALTLADRTDASVLDYGCGYAPWPPTCEAADIVAPIRVSTSATP